MTINQRDKIIDKAIEALMLEAPEDDHYKFEEVHERMLDLVDAFPEKNETIWILIDEIHSSEKLYSEVAEDLKRIFILKPSNCNI